MAPPNLAPYARGAFRPRIVGPGLAPIPGSGKRWGTSGFTDVGPSFLAWIRSKDGGQTFPCHLEHPGRNVDDMSFPTGLPII